MQDKTTAAKDARSVPCFPVCVAKKCNAVRLATAEGFIIAASLAVIGKNRIGAAIITHRMAGRDSGTKDGMAVLHDPVVVIGDMAISTVINAADLATTSPTAGD